MNIAVLGAGKMGGVVGRALAAAGHEIIFGSRSPESTARRFAGVSNISVSSYADAARDSDAAIIAVPWFAALDVIGLLKPDLAGKVVVDLTNPAAADFSQLVVGGIDSAAERIARALPTSKVIKAFNGITADNFPNPDFSGQRAQVFYCGDHEDGKLLVKQLITACGFDPVACGILSNARYLEAIAMLWLQLAFWEDWGTAFSFNIIGERG